ncbi:4-(cytidine 5'-diphospho)-2-C-methyl-D-erythritol kinase [Geobacter sp. SVR]|uniref:4-(cytidine 5'-diphospho)-2-C-methyl-D-erythritol kinase n=1 Tax=Geobacter sp. SVR TaxID=2495594 RepID=UPI00143EF6C1|nr:4-(cytidine 5'-diphospho)-2-C-methyl-D-erythritol kinase [Geobacter sp. SVR]BCS53141.1 4-diphosphocytidyl-2-C-methyl-D-erythritol kinase [Geobacter sp. SVR]GCF84526.1 4-diphosphocytidyl-2-C-methyl-D-erythritol kinase [Geobacter sp. SVR]
MNHLTILAPAKINYLLDVIRRRPDGYHDLRMVMQRINLCDRIEITLNDTAELVVTCGKNGVPDGPGNIAWKAARTLLDLAGTGQGASITIAKNIPVAAGLGGGSSDAASVLMGMNQLLELGLSDRRLMEIGVTLGADVPFFVFKQTALAEGIGEQLRAMPTMPPAWVVLVNPGVHVSTAWVYQNLQLTNRRQLAKLPEFFSSIEDVCAILSNDLEDVTIPSFPVIEEIKTTLLRMGALGAMMSGSGPTVFGLFRDQSTAEAACATLSERGDWFAAAVETL